MQQNKICSVLKFEWVPAASSNIEGPTAFDKDKLEEQAVESVLPLISEGFRYGTFASALKHPEGKAEKNFSCEWSFRESNVGQRTTLPFGINLDVTPDGGSAWIASSLAHQFADEDGYVDQAGEASADALESFLLALAANGVCLAHEQIASALETAVGSIGENLS
jgi:hypothetical protein